MNFRSAASRISGAGGNSGRPAEVEALYFKGRSFSSADDNPANIYGTPKKPKLRKLVDMSSLINYLIVSGLIALFIWMLTYAIGGGRHRKHIVHKQSVLIDYFVPLKTLRYSNVTSMRNPIKKYEWSPHVKAQVNKHRIKSFALTFTDSDLGARHQEAVAAFEANADRFKRENLIHILVQKESYSDFEMFLTPESKKEIPFSVIIDVDRNYRKYKPEGNITAENLINFTESYLAGSVKPWIRSANRWDSSFGGDDWSNLWPINAKDFDSFVLGSTEDVLLVTYIPTCNHSMELVNHMKRVADVFSSIWSSYFFKLNVLANDIYHPGLDTSEIPKVFFFPGKNKTQAPLDFNYRASDLLSYTVSFFEKHASNPLNTTKLRMERYDENPSTPAPPKKKTTSTTTIAADNDAKEAS